MTDELFIPLFCLGVILIVLIALIADYARWYRHRGEPKIMSKEEWRRSE